MSDNIGLTPELSSLPLIQVYLPPEYPGKSLVMSHVPGSATASRQESAAQRYWHALVTPVTALALQVPLMHSAEDFFPEIFKLYNKIIDEPGLKLWYKQDIWRP